MTELVVSLASASARLGGQSLCFILPALAFKVQQVALKVAQRPAMAAFSAAAPSLKDSVVSVAWLKERCEVDKVWVMPVHQEAWGRGCRLPPGVGCVWE
jgi:hypothetical protein